MEESLQRRIYLLRNDLKRQENLILDTVSLAFPATAKILAQLLVETEKIAHPGVDDKEQGIKSPYPEIW